MGSRRLSGKKCGRWTRTRRPTCCPSIGDDGAATLFPAQGDDVESDTRDLPYVVPERREGLRASLSRGLKELESLSVDSKLSAFSTKLMTMRGDKTELHRTCVFTEYRATVYYLQGQLKEASFNTHIFHGGLSPDDKAQSLGRFKLGGGVLLATMGNDQGHRLFPPSTDSSFTIYPPTHACSRKSPLEFSGLDEVNRLR